MSLCTKACLYACWDLANVFSHKSLGHLNGFSWVWIYLIGFTLLCFERLLAFVNFLSQPSNWHGYGFSPVCTLLWIDKLVLAANFLEHSSHSYSFFPLWVRSCLFSDWASPNRWWQVPHSNGLSPVSKLVVINEFGDGEPCRGAA